MYSGNIKPEHDGCDTLYINIVCSVTIKIEHDGIVRYVEAAHAELSIIEIIRSKTLAVDPI